MILFNYVYLYFCVCDFHVYVHVMCCYIYIFIYTRTPHYVFLVEESSMRRCNVVETVPTLHIHGRIYNMHTLRVYCVWWVRVYAG